MVDKRVTILECMILSPLAIFAAVYTILIFVVRFIACMDLFVYLGVSSYYCVYKRARIKD